MTGEKIEKTESDGWETPSLNEFNNLIGPIWHRLAQGRYEFNLITEPRHCNKNLVMHGGFLVAFADHALGMAARLSNEIATIATVNLNCQMLDMCKAGARLYTKPKVLRATKSLIFMDGEIFADDRLVAAANGVFKKLRPQQDEKTDSKNASGKSVHPL
jgi:uncharacterized protein (TIGR00369 family)